MYPYGHQVIIPTAEMFPRPLGTLNLLLFSTASGGHGDTTSVSRNSNSKLAVFSGSLFRVRLPLSGASPTIAAKLVAYREGPDA
jgi:hypothetical protein